MSRPIFTVSAGVLLIIVAVEIFFLSKNSVWPGQRDGGRIIEEARAAVLSTLRDPASAQFSDEVALGSEAAPRTVCGSVNAKNGFGGYTGKAIFIYQQQSKNVEIASNADQTGEIMQSCRQAKIDELKARIALLCKQKPDNQTCKERYEAGR